MSRSDLRIVYMGTPEFAVAGLAALVEGGYNVVAVVTMPDKPSGRGHHIQFSPVKEYALQHQLPILQPEKLKAEEFIAELRSYRADLQIVVAFRMLPEVVWAMPRLGTFNVHGSLLPQYRGAAPINWAIINGEKETGLTSFMLRQDIDTGNMILQKRITVGEEEDVGSVHDRLMELSRTMVIETTDLIIDCDSKGIALPTTPQPEGIELRPAPKIFKEDCEIRKDMTCEQVHNFVRGLSPYPCAWTTISAKGQTFINTKIYRVRPYAPSSHETITLPCKDGAVEVVELQVPGKKRMDVKSFLNGLH